MRDAILRRRRFHERRAPGIVAPVREDDHQPGRIRRTQQLSQHERAASSAPLRIVDPEDQLMTISEASQQLAQRLDALTTELLQLDREPDRQRLRQPRHPTEHWEEPK